jgi:hypothetical protein
VELLRHEETLENGGTYTLPIDLSGVEPTAILPGEE